MQPTATRADALDFRRISAQSEYHHTKRLALRSLSACDGWPLFTACQVRAFTQNLLWKPPSRHVEMFDRVEAILSEVRLNRMAAASIVLRETGEWAGLVRYFPSLIEGGPENAIEGGVWLHPKFWQSRMGGEIGSLMSSACFLEEPSLQSIVCRTSKSNRAVNRMVVDIGFSIIGEGVTRREDGSSMEILRYAISRADWAARPRPNQLVGEDVQWQKAA